MIMNTNNNYIKVLFVVNTYYAATENVELGNGKDDLHITKTLNMTSDEFIDKYAKNKKAATQLKEDLDEYGKFILGNWNDKKLNKFLKEEMNITDDELKYGYIKTIFTL